MTVFVFLKNRLRQAREWLLDYAYWVTLSAMIAVIVGTALYTDRLRQAENVQAAAPAPEVASPSPAPTATPSPLPTLAPVRLPSIAGAVRPVSGGLLRGFSAQPVLWPSLDCWQAHPAVDLGAASGETAVCMRDGVVLSCVRDDLWGWHVAVRQTDGAVCTYSGLSCARAGRSKHRARPAAGRRDGGRPGGKRARRAPASFPLSGRRGSRTHAARLIFPNFQILPIHRKELSKYIK